MSDKKLMDEVLMVLKHDAACFNCSDKLHTANCYRCYLDSLISRVEALALKPKVSK